MHIITDIGLELLRKLNKNNKLVLIIKNNICLGSTPLKSMKKYKVPQSYSDTRCCRIDELFLYAGILM